MAGGVFKLSLHGSGHWQSAIASGTGFPGTEAERIGRAWKRPAEVIPGWTRAFEVWIPNTAVVPWAHTRPEKTDDVHWFDPPPPLGDPASVFGIWLAGPEVPLDTDEWPVINGYANDALTRFPLANGDTVWLTRVSTSIAHDARKRIDGYMVEHTPEMSLAMGAQPGDVVVGCTVLDMDDTHDDPRAAVSKWFEAPFEFRPGPRAAAR